MQSGEQTNKTFKIFISGLLAGIFLAVLMFGAYCYKMAHPDWKSELKASFNFFQKISIVNKAMIKETFHEAVLPAAGKSFGSNDQLTFELFRNGTFEIDGKSGYAYQKSPSYRDSAFIRSARKLPKTYKIIIEAGEINYDLDKISKLPKDPEYPEGPNNENGCYLLSITDQKPEGHHTNIWWHQHRKLVIDVDNNVWGHGMPNPIFMVYFDRSNRLMSYDGQREEWMSDWRKAVTYDPAAWYKIELEKTKTHFIFTIATSHGKVLKKGKVALKNVWGEDGFHDDYFVVGDPHENYYQGSMKIKSISFTEK